MHISLKPYIPHARPWKTACPICLAFWQLFGGANNSACEVKKITTLYEFVKVEFNDGSIRKIPTTPEMKQVTVMFDALSRNMYGGAMQSWMAENPGFNLSAEWFIR